MSADESASSDLSAVTAEEKPPPPERLGPAVGSDRIESVDVLRGVAVLGILAMNIYAFAMPFAAYANPLRHGGASGIDLGTWFFTHLFFDQKFMPIFSMLFGAGLVMMFERARQRGTKMAGVYYRRNFWLFVFGMVQAYLIWFGDILVTYAVLGFLIFFLRRSRPRTLLIAGSAVLLVGLSISSGMGHYFVGLERKIEALRSLDETMTPEQARQIEEWEKGMGSFLNPSPEILARDIEIHRGSYAEIFAQRIPTAAMMQTMAFLTFNMWRAGGLMLFGMALMKLGIFSARRSAGFYVRQLAIGYGLGLPLVAVGAYELHRHEFDGIYVFKTGIFFNYIGSLGVTLGHVAVVMLAVKLGWLPGLVSRLASAGRMAFTNYLSHSILLTPIFYGYGLGLYGQVDRFAQMGFVLGMWALQLWWSPLWLRWFRFGPLEWLWRSLTYSKRQPLRRISPQTRS